MESKANNDNVFNVPCVVVDNFLQMATGEYIKVLLYILRSSGRDFEENEISDETGVSQEEVTKAIDFWRRAKILTSNNTGINTAVQQKTEGSVSENSSGRKTKGMPNLSASDIAKIKTSDPEMSELIEVAENLLGILNHAQLSSIIQMHNYLGLKKEVIITLIDYCRKIGRTYVGYIEAVAYGWSDRDINTLETAQQEVERLLAKDDYTNRVKRITKGSAFSKSDEEFIEKWHKMNIPLELIEEAYDITAESIHKLSFKYMDRVIMSRTEGNTDTGNKKPVYKNKNNKNTGRKKVHNDDDFDVDMYKIFINDFEVI